MISIEKTKEKYRKFERRFLNHGSPDNLIPVHGNAIGFLVRDVPPSSIDRLILNYPNPYPKASQKKKRWVNQPFFKFALSRIKPGGSIHIATNISDYANEVESTLLKIKAIKLASKNMLNLEAVNKHGYCPITHFEKKYLLDKQTCHHLVFNYLGEENLRIPESSSRQI